MDLLFVYGTLRPGFNHPMARYLSERGQLLGRGMIRGRLYNLGRYPGLVETEGEDWVVGELIALPEDGGQTLAELDRYENIESPRPAFFERCRAEIQREGGTTIRAWVYWFRGQASEKHLIPEGDWFAHSEQRKAPGHPPSAHF